MNEIKLKPCPFCGGKAQIVKTQSGYKQNPSTILDTWAVQCENKCCRTMEFGDRIFRKEDGEIIVEEDGVKAAIEFWNRRAYDNTDNIRELMRSEGVCEEDIEMALSTIEELRRATMAEYIEREKIYADISRLLICKSTADLTNCEDGWTSAISEAMDVIKNAPTSDVRPERHGHVVWKERHSGGFRTVKCLHEFPDIIKENNISCKHIAKFDDRCTVKEPYCSECGKRLGDFINFCGNCGAKMQEAKMDGKDDKSD